MENIEIKYKIIETNAETHSMIVRYFTDEYDEDKLATSFTFDNKLIYSLLNLTFF
mgnify:CR=1 FL=1